MKLSRRCAIQLGMVTVCVGVLAIPAAAAWPVIDFSNLAQAALRLTELKNQLQQLVQTYNRITQQYNHMVHQAKYIANLFRYQAPSTTWRGLSGTDTYGKTGGWINAVNSGLNTLQGWEDATIRILTYPGGLASIPALQRQRKRTDFATLELQDGTAVSAMDIIGRIRLNGPRVEAALALLESDSLSADPDMHTEAAQLNKANAIALIQTKALTDQNKLLVTHAEIGLLRMKQERDAAAYALANDVAFRTDGKNVLEAQHAGASVAILAYRLP